MYYYRYVFANNSLKKFSVWDYSQQITDALKKYYSSNLISVEFSKSYYGFWLNIEKNDGKQRLIGKQIASNVKEFDDNKATYNYLYSDKSQGISTQIFIEDKSKRKTVDVL